MSFGMILFLLCLIACAGAAAVIFGNTGQYKSTFKEKIKKYSSLIAVGCTAVSVISLILDVSGIADLSGYHLMPAAAAIMCIVSLAAAKGWIRVKEKFRNILDFSLRAFSVCMMLELFVFNLNSAHLLSGGYEQTEMDLRSANNYNFNSDNRTNNTGGYAEIEFTSVNAPVGTVTVFAESSSKSKVDINISMSDDTHFPSYRSNTASAQVIKGYERSRTVPCNFSGNVHDLKLHINAEDNEIITVSRVAFNIPVMFHFSLLRFVVMFGSALIVFALSSPELLMKEYSERKKAVEICAWAITAVLIAVSLFLTNMGRYREEDHSISKDFGMNSGNQISQEIVDAFESGRVDLDIDMNETLLGLDNPYDWSQRDDIGYYPWDHLLYNGKYYSYYGIASVLGLFWPYYKITGHYFPSSWAVWLFGVFGIMFLTKFYLCFADKFFRKAYASFVIAGFAIMQFSTGIFLCYYAAYFYEIAQASGFLCVAAGAYYLISSNVIGEGKVKNSRMAGAAFWLSMGVLSRPTIAVYCLASLIFIYAGFRKKQKLWSEELKISKKKYYIPYFLCSLLPFVILGSVQIWYNYARFGNPLEFGIKYSLTINDFINSQYHTHFALAGFFGYLFELPKFTESFPFFSAEYPNLFSPQGYYFIATGSALGLLWRALPIAAYGKSLKAYRLSENPDKKLYTAMFIAVCILCPFAVMFSIWESGFAARYCVDFAWEVIIGALVICSIVQERLSDNARRQLNKLMIFSAFLSLAMNFVQEWTYNYPLTDYNTDWQSRAYALSRIFEFWK